MKNALKTFCLAAMIIAATRLSTAAVFQETFDMEETAVAHGWATLGNGAGNLGAENQVGWSNSNDAGGTGPGEARANFRQCNAQVYYADTNLGLTVNGTSPNGFSAVGKLNVVGLQNEPDFGLAPLVGFFNPTSSSSLGQDRLGIVFNNDGNNLVWGIVFIAGGGVSFFAGFDAAHTVPINVQRNFSLQFDPTASANGRVTASISDTGAPFTMDLTPGQRTTLDGMNFSAFGFQMSDSGASVNRGANFRFDDVTYTHSLSGLAGDYNNNGVVDAVDYVLWRANVGTTNPLDNDMIQGEIGPAQYEQWAEHFGDTIFASATASSLAPAAVPKGSTAILLTIACCGLLIQRVGRSSIGGVNAAVH